MIGAKRSFSDTRYQCKPQSFLHLHLPILGLIHLWILLLQLSLKVTTWWISGIPMATADGTLTINVQYGPYTMKTSFQVLLSCHKEVWMSGPAGHIPIVIRLGWKKVWINFHWDLSPTTLTWMWMWMRLWLIISVLFELINAVFSFCICVFPRTSGKPYCS